MLDRTEADTPTEPARLTRPDFHPSCDECRALERRWYDATEPRGPGFNPSAATDVRVSFARHCHGEGLPV
ncbi:MULTISPECIES: hypothetical protein [unclassified Streptomyces]|uniref:hypothetical protein n=1 Tax=unclassified Streptomyces TaxID=2593676 RepID=UPI000B6A810B|nr:MULTISPECIES: hypothetical protein [unclassified Streptomyces]MYX02258.1 hypothetical protein [Streptomyces sp. SID8378]SNB64012.1 hypothetical protein SAMN02745831_00392 [Streptomyces sp. PgraA7]